MIVRDITRLDALLKLTEIVNARSANTDRYGACIRAYWLLYKFVGISCLVEFGTIMIKGSNGTSFVAHCSSNERINASIREGIAPAEYHCWIAYGDTIFDPTLSNKTLLKAWLGQFEPEDSYAMVWGNPDNLVGLSYEPDTIMTAAAANFVCNETRNAEVIENLREDIAAAGLTEFDLRSWRRVILGGHNDIK